MRITKRQLRRIIKEEKHRILKEQGMPGIEGPVRDLWGPKEDQAVDLKTADEWADHLGQIIDQDMTSRGLTSYREEGAAVVEALEMLRREIKDEMRGPTR